MKLFLTAVVVLLGTLASLSQAKTGQTTELTKRMADRQKPVNCGGHISSTPVFNPFPIAYDVGSTPFCHDFPLIDVARDVPNPHWSKSKRELNSVHRYGPGSDIIVGIYLDNGAASNFPPAQTTAKNVKITTSMNRKGNVYTLAVRVSADNAPTKSGFVKIAVGKNERLDIVPNSGYMYDYKGRLVLDSQRLELGDSTYTLGDLDADFQYSVFLTFKIQDRIYI